MEMRSEGFLLSSYVMFSKAHHFLSLGFEAGGSDAGSGPRGGPAGRRQGGKQKKGRNDNNEGDGRNSRKQSLRIGTGRKGRGAELNQRRGSLKKRDRSAEKAARAEAAIERKTVNLPE